MSILIGLLTLTSCKIYENKQRDKRKEFEMDWQHLQQRQRQYTFRKDTLSRLWYFWTDSAFRFHPDSGLFAQSGSLLGQELQGSISTQSRDRSETDEQGRLKASKQQRNSKKLLSAEYLWPFGFVLVLFLLWKWFRSRLSP
ncbi:hypothetical protein [Sphingobacterium sp. HMA12]|uniref:hypothetical protein n=1 Tax=Sphingobacterium sp. HMA12 TaxID=2050894 RepID=UPI001F282080|nr:hypothetical protein [Sphingobacterium sp. HMA12]